MDDLYREIHQEMTEKYLDLHPETPWDQAYDRTTLAAYDEYRERVEAATDELRKRRLEGG